MSTDGIPWYVMPWHVWSELMDDGPIGYVLGFFIALLVIGTVLWTLYQLLLLADRVRLPTLQGDGKIVQKWTEEGHWDVETYTEMAWNHGEYGPVVMTRDVWVDEQPFVRVGLYGSRTTEDFAVSREEYDRTARNAPVRIVYQPGRFTGRPYIVSYERV